MCRFDLGDAAPQANGVKVYTMENGAEEIMVEVDFSWVGNQDVQLTMKPFPKHLGPFSPAGALISSIIRLRASCKTLEEDFQGPENVPIGSIFLQSSFDACDQMPLASSGMQIVTEIILSACVKVVYMACHSVWDVWEKRKSS